MNKYLKDYMAGTQASDISGFEHLNTLMVRDKLFEQNELLTTEEKAELLKADYLLIEHISSFLLEVEEITTLKYERENRNRSSEQWWWYLDVINHLPVSLQLPAHNDYINAVVA